MMKATTANGVVVVLLLVLVCMSSGTRGTVMEDLATEPTTAGTADTGGTAVPTDVSSSDPTADFGTLSSSATTFDPNKYAITAGMATRFRSFFHSLPRLDLHFHTVSNDFQPQNKEYIESLVLLGVPFVVFGVVAVVVATLICLFRCCWRCCSDTEYEGAPVLGISRGQRFCRFFSRGLVIFLVILITLSALGGVAASFYFDYQYNQFMDEGFATANTLYKSADSFTVTIKEIPSQYFGTGTQSTITALENALKGIVSDAHTYLDQAQDIRDGWANTIEKIRSYVVLGSYGIVLFLCILGLCGAMFLWRWCAKLMTWMCVLVLLVMFISAGVNIPPATAASDLCPDMDDYVENEVFASVPNNDATFYLTCNTTTDISHELLYFDIFANSMVNQGGCGNETKNSNDLAACIKNFTILLSDVNVLTDCNATADAYNEGKYRLCVDAFDAVVVMTVSELLIGVLVILLGMVGVYAQTSWKKGQHEDAVELYHPINGKGGRGGTGEHHGDDCDDVPYQHTDKRDRLLV
eukprot:TRINITY_DN1043_c1_g3_i1.p1 TRINITY_DN1043_c1_g3~~TRINITY_DN1043_c1_g3_i1.p1  ORF type:complete len:524 (+),score=104.45 TRINITY_DN1043_c1_g3_i1:193-1764(+)